MQRVRRILKRIRREPVLIAAAVSVATALGLDDVAAHVGWEITESSVAGAIGVVLLATRWWTNSRRHVRTDLWDADGVKREIMDALGQEQPGEGSARQGDDRPSRDEIREAVRAG